MTEKQKQALQYIAAVVSAYANTLPDPVKGPLVRECQSAFAIIEAEPKTEKPDA